MKNFSSPGQPNRLRKPSLALIALLVLVLALLVFNLVYLATDLAPRIGRDRGRCPRHGYRVDIDIGPMGKGRHRAKFWQQLQPNETGRVSFSTLHTW